MLARKSRKNLVENEVVKCDLLKAAGYIRLSVNKADFPSDFIENQKKIIEDYAATNLDIQFKRFYIDDNASGRDFDRPAFNKMLEDIRNERINCVIVKDLSRLGRNLIEVGYYVQMLFPSKSVRFISITNKIDTLDGMTNIAFEKRPGDKIPLTSLLDEQYAIDISQKTQFVLDNYIKDGKCVAPHAPYGYRKSESDCHVIIPDIEAAAVVKEIFEMASRQTSINEIVRRLNAAKILTPINYAIEHSPFDGFIRFFVCDSHIPLVRHFTNAFLKPFGHGYPKIRLHGLRHTCAAEWYEEYIAAGFSELEARKKVSRLLGHNRDDVTRIYLASLYE